MGRNTKVERPGVWQLPPTDPRRIKLEKLEGDYLRRHLGRWTYKSVQKFSDHEAAKLGIQARRWGGTLTEIWGGSPMGIPPEEPAGKIIKWQADAKNGKPVPWIMVSADG